MGRPCFVPITLGLNVQNNFPPNGDFTLGVCYNDHRNYKRLNFARGLIGMTNNELLLAISEMMDTKLDAKLKPLENRLKHIEVDLLENNAIPRLNTIEACYTSTFNRYKDSVEDYEAIKQDIAIMKKVIAEHSEKLQKLA